MITTTLGLCLPRLLRRPRGFTLIELVVSMAIMGIIAMGMSGLVFNAGQAQISDHALQMQEHIAMEILDTLRGDLKTAAASTVVASGNTLQFDRTNPQTGALETVRYSFANDTLTRTVGTQTRDFRSNSQPAVRIYTAATSGQTQTGFHRIDRSDGMTASQVSLFNLHVEEANPAQTSLGQALGASRFRVFEANFNLVTALSYQ